MTEDEARLLFLDHCQPGNRGVLERHGERPAIAAILALAAPADGWQGIESAPDDGESVDVWLAPLDDGGNALTPCRQPNAWFECGGWWCWPSGSVGPVRINHRITHWMPLPAAPTGGRS